MQFSPAMKPLAGFNRVLRSSSGVYARVPASFPPVQTQNEESNFKLNHVFYLSTRIWLGQLFWSLSTELNSDIHFFAIKHEGTFNYALFFYLIYFMPCILQFKQFQEIRKYSFAVSFVGLCANFLPHTPFRTLLLAVGVGGVICGFWSQWSDYPSYMSDHVTYSVTMGLLMHIMIRFCHFSLDPAFDCFAYAIVCMVLTILCSFWVGVEQYDTPTLPQRAVQGPIYGFLSDIVDSSIVEEEDDCTDGSIDSDNNPCQWLTQGLAVGSTFFLTALLFSNYGTVCRWVGIKPYPSSILIILFLAIGIAIGNVQRFHNMFSYLLLLFGALLVSFGDSILGMAGGMIAALFMPLCWFVSVGDICPKSIGRTYFIAVCTVFFLSTLHYMDANYGGLDFLTVNRNGGWVLLFIPVLFLVPAFCNNRRSIFGDSKKKTKLSWPPREFLVILLFLSMIGMLTPFLVRAVGKVSQQSSHSFIPLVGPVGPPIGRKLHGVPRNTTYPLIVAQLNLDQGYHLSGNDNAQQLLQFFEEQKPHIFGFHMSEAMRFWTGNRDLIDYLSNRLQLHSSYGFHSREFTSGMALLSKYPILHSHTIAVQDTRHQRAGIILDVSLNVTNITAGPVNHQCPLQVLMVQADPKATTHSKQILLQQVVECIQAMPKRAVTILMGDVATEENSTVLDVIKQESLNDAYAAANAGFTYNSTQFVYYKNLRVNDATVWPQYLSRHQPIIAFFYPELKNPVAEQ